jgi:hypothetical protein
VLNKRIIIKIIIIFSVGLMTRYFINEYYNINVFSEYTSGISIAYYTFMSVFTNILNKYFSLTTIPLGSGDNMVNKKGFILSSMEDRRRADLYRAPAAVRGLYSPYGKDRVSEPTLGFPDNIST